MSVIDDLQGIISYCQQPGQPSGAGAHWARFYLNSRDGLTYWGFMEFLPPAPGMTAMSLGHFHGYGYAFPNTATANKVIEDNQANQLTPTFLDLWVSLTPMGGG